MLANFTAGRFAGQDIPRGSFARSWASLARDIGGGATVKKLRGTMARLEAEDFLRVEAGRGKQFLTITIVNYESYQAEPGELGKQRASKGQAKGIKRATIEEPKNLRTEEEGPDGSAIESSPPSKPKKPKAPPSEDAIRLSNFLQRHIAKADPGHVVAKAFPASKLNAWAATIDKAIKLDKRTVEELKAGIEWLFATGGNLSREPKFQLKIFSAEALRAKFEKVRVGMKTTTAPKLRDGMVAASRPTNKLPSQLRAEEAAKAAAES